MKVIVIGTGIIGACIAFELAQRGSEVIAVEQAAVTGGIATAASFAWINAAHGNPHPYFQLRMRSIGRWRELAKLFPNAGIRLDGSVTMDLAGKELADSVATLASWGYGIRLVERSELSRLEPGLANPPQWAAIAADEGMVEGVDLAARLIEASGAQLLTANRVTGLRFSGSRVTGITTDSGSIDADAVVVAAGTGSPAILADAGFDLPLRTPPGLLLHTAPAGTRLHRLAITRDIHVRQRRDGSYLAGSDFIGTFDIENPRNTAIGLLDKLRHLVGDPAIEMAHWTIGERPTPLDGFPATGAIPGVDGLHVAVSHSGITLGPALGLMLAEEILEGRVDPLLTPYRAARFALSHGGQDRSVGNA